jgi:MFS family permease
MGRAVSPTLEPKNIGVAENIGNQTSLEASEHSRRRKLLLALAIGILLGGFDGAVIATVLPAIARNLGGTENLLWLASGYLFGTALAAPAWGAIGDARGHVFVVKLGMWMLFISTSACAAAGALDIAPVFFPPWLQLALFRFVQGTGSAAIFTGGFAMLGELLPPRRRARRTGAFSLIFAVATVLSPFIGGAISDGVHADLFGVKIAGWRFIFILQLPISLISLWLIGPAPGRRQAARERFDYAGLFLIGVIVLSSATVLQAIRSARAGFEAAMAAAAVAVSLAALSAVERRASRPLLPPELLEIGPVRRSCLIGALNSAALTSFAISMPANLQLSLGMSATASGAAMASFSFGIAAGAFAGGRFAGRSGRLRDAAIGAIGVALLGLITLAVTPAAAGIPLLTTLFVIGVGFGPLQSFHAVVAQVAAPATRQGGAVGLVQFFRRLGSSAGATAGGLLVARKVQTTQTSVDSINFSSLLPAALCAIFLVVSLVIVFRLPRDPLPDG